jgi:hypothetical protein
MPERNNRRPDFAKKGWAENLPFCDANHRLITHAVTCAGAKN